MQASSSVLYSTPSYPPASAVVIFEPVIEPSMELSSSQQASSESESEEEARFDSLKSQEAERLLILTAAGLVRKPTLVARRSQPLLSQPTSPSTPPGDSYSIPLPSRGLLSPTSTRAPTPLRYQFDNDGKEDGMERMEDALARYLKLQNEVPQPPSSRTSDNISDELRLTTRKTRSSSQSVSIPPSASSSRPSPRFLATPSITSGTTGFRAWLSNMSRTVSAATSGSITTQSSERPSRPSISAPAMGAPISIIEQKQIVSSNMSASSFKDFPPGESGLLGQTWASSVDPGLVTRSSEKERNRQEAIFELINTEAAFVKNCQILTQVFYSQLESILSPKASIVIFANIEDITLFGTTFLSALEERQHQSQNNIEMIGDVICNYMQGIEIYRPYCKNQSNASRVLSQLKKNPKINYHLSKLKVKGLELEHYLLQPMQRITRYPLLLEKILRYTEDCCPDHRLIKASLKRSQDVLQEINEAIREQENELALASLSEQLMIPGSDAKLNLATMTRFVGPRRLIREGILTKSRSRKTFHAYLLNDFFLLTTIFGTGFSGGFLESSSSKPQTQPPTQQIMYRAPMALEECQFKDGRDESSFVVIHASETYNLKVPEGARACAAWKEDLRTYRRNVFLALTARKSKRASLDPSNRSSGSIRSLEESDSSSLEISRFSELMTTPRPNSNLKLHSQNNLRNIQEMSSQNVPKIFVGNMSSNQLNELSTSKPIKINFC